MGDDNFVKLYVCLHNRWNPYSDEVKNIPTHYWISAFYMLRHQVIIRWKESLEPHAELIGQLTHPEIFKEYKKYKDSMERKRKEGKPLDVTISTDKGTMSHAIADVHYDPLKGLVDFNGKIVVPKGKFDEKSQMDGIALSI